MVSAWVGVSEVSILTRLFLASHFLFEGSNLGVLGLGFGGGCGVGFGFGWGYGVGWGSKYIDQNISFKK